MTKENLENEEVLSEATEAEAVGAEVIEEVDELKEANDKYLRLLAEYDNFRKRSVKERENAKIEGISRTVAAFLTTYDNLERALKQSCSDEAYVQGIELVMRGFLESMEKLGVTELKCEVGDTFDPNLHNAVMHIEDENLGENQIAQVFAKGFIYKDKVIRYAMVQSAN